MSEVDLRKQRKVDVITTIDPAGLATSAKQDIQISQLVSGATPSQTTQTASALSVTLKVSNVNRKEIIIYNSSTKTLWIRYGASVAVVGEGIPLFKDSFLVEDKYNGELRGIWEVGATGSATITEVST